VVGTLCVVGNIVVVGNGTSLVAKNGQDNSFVANFHADYRLHHLDFQFEMHHDVFEVVVAAAAADVVVVVVAVPAVVVFDDILVFALVVVLVAVDVDVAVNV
jgi:hypothetical protein